MNSYEKQGYELMKQLVLENKTITSDSFYKIAVSNGLSPQVSRDICSFMFRRARANGLIVKTNKCITVTYRTENSHSTGIRQVWKSLVYVKKEEIKDGYVYRRVKSPSGRIATEVDEIQPKVIRKD